jgi:hypothetical protein
MRRAYDYKRHSDAHVGSGDEELCNRVHDQTVLRSTWSVCRSHSALMVMACDLGCVSTLRGGIVIDGALAKIGELLVMPVEIGMPCDTVASPAAPATPAAPAAIVKIDRAIDRVVVLVCRRAMVRRSRASSWKKSDADQEWNCLRR